MKPSESGVFFVGRLLVKDSISLTDFLSLFVLVLTSCVLQEIYPFHQNCLIYWHKVIQHNPL